MSDRAEGFYLARRDTRWDVYPCDEPPELVHVERRGGFAVIRNARWGFEYPFAMVLIEQAHGAIYSKQATAEALLAEWRALNDAQRDALRHCGGGLARAPKWPSLHALRRRGLTVGAALTEHGAAVLGAGLDAGLAAARSEQAAGKGGK